MSYQNKQLNYVTEIKSVTKEEGTEDLIIEGYANTISKDRAGDVIPADAWMKPGALENFYKNPIILAFHDHKQPIGKAIEVMATEMGLKIRARISAAAEKVHALIRDGILTTFSVGFMIKDARYEPKDDTFYITEVELTEVSVVSVPCNQDSTFSVAKSVDSKTLDELKSQFIKKEKPKMDNFDLEAFKASLLGDVKNVMTDTITAQKAAEAAEAKRIAEEEAAKAAQATATKAVAMDTAKALISELEAKLNEKDTAFAAAVTKHQEQIVAVKEEIAQILAARQNPVNLSQAVKSAFMPHGVTEKDIDSVVMLGMIKKMDMFATNHGKNHLSAVKAVNSSSSIQVSSESYETVFSTNLLRDIQAQLIIAPLFTEIPMTSATLTMPINPNRGAATWVDAGDYGTDASTGAELTVTLTERTFKTFKLAAKTYMTEETQEDAILALLPILRQHLVEAHAQAIDTAFLRGTGTGQPKGLITHAAAIGAAATEVTTAKADGTVKVTAKMLVAARRKLGLYGIKLNEIALVISQDAYWDLILDDEWADVQQVGGVATKLVGEVGNIYGMPVLVSNEFPAKAVNAAYAVLVNRGNFVVPRQRSVTVKSDFDVEKDRSVFVATQRLNLEGYILTAAGHAKGVVQVTYAAA